MEDTSSAVRMFRGSSVASRVLEQMLCDETLSDVTVCAGGKRFACHRAVLASSSPVFRAMFAVDMKETNTGILTLPPDVTASVFNAVRDFMYGRPLRVTSDDAISLYKFVQRYEIAFSELQNFLDNLLASALTVDNVVHIRQHADSLNAFRLRRACDRFITLRLSSMSTTDSFLDASADAAESVLLAPSLVSRDILGPRSAQHVLAAALAWLRHDDTRVSLHLDRILRTVRLDHLSLPALVRASREPLLEASVTFQHKLLRAFALNTERYVSFGSVSPTTSSSWISSNCVEDVSADDEREYDEDDDCRHSLHHRRLPRYRRRLDFVNRFQHNLSHVRRRSSITPAFVRPRLAQQSHSHSHMQNHSYAPSPLPPQPPQFASQGTNTNSSAAGSLR